jgi:FKBP-type peptidyl-prolyl cis-trans isomerase
VAKHQGTQLSNLTPVAKVDSLQKIDATVGTGAEAKADSTVTVSYTGALASTGVIFESSIDSGQPVTFALNQVIKGWQEGIPGMKVGGSRRLMIPASLAYGAQGNSTIPANSDLVFDVSLVSVK